jgi:hypothetical protein
MWIKRVSQKVAKKHLHPYLLLQLLLLESMCPLVEEAIHLPVELLQGHKDLQQQISLPLFADLEAERANAEHNANHVAIVDNPVEQLKNKIE